MEEDFSSNSVNIHDDGGNRNQALRQELVVLNSECDALLQERAQGELERIAIQKDEKQKEMIERELQGYRERSERLKKNTPKFEAAKKRQREREFEKLKRREESQSQSPQRARSLSPSKRKSIPLSTPPRKQSLKDSTKPLPAPPPTQSKKMKNPGYRLYQNGMEMEIMKRQWTTSQRAYKKLQEENHPFRPAITRYAEGVDREQAFNRKRPVKAPIVTSRDREVVECTFQPNLIRRSVDGQIPDPNTHNRLFDDANCRVQRSHEVRSLQEAIRSSHLPNQLRQPAVKVGSYETEKWLHRLVYSSVHQEATLNKIRKEALKQTLVNAVPNKNRRSVSVPAPSEKNQPSKRIKEVYTEEILNGDIGIHISNATRTLADEKRVRDLKEFFQDVQEETRGSVTVADLTSYCKKYSSKEDFYSVVLRDLVSKRLPDSQPLHESDVVAMLSKSTSGPLRRIRSSSRNETPTSEIVISNKSRQLAVTRKVKELTELYRVIALINSSPPTVADILHYCWERRHKESFYQAVHSDMSSKRLPDSQLLTQSDFVAILQTTTKTGPKHKKRSSSVPRRFDILDSINEECTFKPRILDYKPPPETEMFRKPIKESAETQQELLQKTKVDILDRLRVILATSNKGY